MYGVLQHTVRWPGKVRARQTSDFVWTHYDLFSTFADIAGASIPQGLDGISVLPALLGQNQPNRKYLYWEFHEGRFVQALRMGAWKAVRMGLNGNIELYDLSKDVAETRDVAGQNPAIVAEITAMMKREHVESPLWPDSDK